MKTTNIRNIIFWVMIAVFILLAAIVLRFSRLCGVKLPAVTMLYFAAAFFVLAGALVVLTIKITESRIRRFFFLLTGASAVAIPICAVLHNVVYGLFFHGKDGDEAVFFILAILVCPGLFILGILGVVLTIVSEKYLKNKYKIQSKKINSE